MKKYFLTMGAVAILFSCSDEHYEGLNQDPVNPSNVPAGLLVNAATESLFDQMVNTNVNLNIFRLVAQFWNETTYVTETNYDLDTRNINGNLWNELYTDVLYDLKDAKTKIDNDILLTAEEKNNQKAVISIMEVFTWQILVDTFGNVPYSQALLGTENPLPAYDDAATIYGDLMTRLNEAISTISTSSPGFSADYDVIYSGDMNQWKKLGASLKLRLAMQLADVNSSAASTAVSEALSAGVFTSNADNFTIPYTAGQPTNNPLWDDLVASGRTDFVAANTVVDYMNPLNDPRRPIYFQQNLGEGVYVGGEYGNPTNYALHTHVGEIFHTPDFPGTLMEYAEVEFLLAEAVERGFAVGGSAESHYNAGIMASMDYWGVSPSDAAAYLAQSGVAYGSAPGSWKEKIGKQFWLAMYNNGFIAWNTWRRLDAPTMNVAATTGRTVPFRYTYPALEGNLNPDNYAAAASAIGGDDIYTKLFWDVN